MAEVQRHDWRDLGYTGLVTVERGLAQWVVVEVIEASVNGGPLALYVREAMNNGDGLDGSDEALLRATPLVRITVKTDGCADYFWDETCATHTCDAEGNRKLAAMLQRVHSTSGELIPGWCGG